MKKEEDTKLGKQKVKWKKYKLCNTITYRPSPSTFFKMKKKTKVMLSSPSNPKHKLRKCNVKSKRRKKYKRREILLIEKLRVDPKYQKMKVRKKGHNRYIKMQEGGLGAFHGTSRYRGRGGGMFGMLAKSVRSMLPKFQM